MNKHTHQNAHPLANSHANPQAQLYVGIPAYRDRSFRSIVTADSVLS